jgi:small GTP-binding protein
MSLSSKIAEIEDEIARTQRNKATMKHLGELKAKLAKYRRELLEGPKGGSGGPGEGFEVRKTGDIRIGLVGFPSVGKSTLMNKLTNTFSEVASYEFTTLTCVPGVFYYKGAKVQLLDLPGIIEGAKDGKGRGRQVISVAKSCSLILIVLDSLKPLGHKAIIEKELEGFGIRLNQEPANITFKKKEKGGVNFSSTFGHPPTHLDTDTVKSILSQYRMHCADVILREDATADQLIDVIEGNRAYIPALYVLNKIDQITIEELDLLCKVPNTVPISAHHQWNLDGLLEKVFEKANLVRIYTKPKGEIPDYTSPVCMRGEKASVKEFAGRIHKSLVTNFKFAIVWGSSVKFSPQKVGLAHMLADEDVVQIVTQ